MLPTTSLTNLMASLGQITNETVPVLQPYAYLAIAIGISFTVLSTVIGYFKYQNMDNSKKIGGFYLKNLPCKGYSRWHSEAWNMQHTIE